MVNQEDTGNLKNISVRKVLRFPFTYLFFRSLQISVGVSVLFAHDSHIFYLAVVFDLWAFV